jgi:phosphoribosylformylglycinamidine synthase
MSVKRIYVEKRQGFFDIPAQALCADLIESFGLTGLKAVRIITRYDIEGLSDKEYKAARNIVFSEPTVDTVYDEVLPNFPNSKMFAVEYLPGQYDQTADSAAQCVQLITQKERPTIRTAHVIILVGQVSDEDMAKVKAYCINAVESREASLEKPASLEMAAAVPPDVAVVGGFTKLDEKLLQKFMDVQGFAMSFADLKFCQEYFRKEQRDPTITELKVIDTYWSDHCRHTTFTTQLKDVEIEDGALSAPIKLAYQLYLDGRKNVYGEDTERDMTLMDIAVIGMKELRRLGKLEDLDASDEINACSIVVNADIDGKDEEWLVMFKNETHNHPTEIEPFGGAATCLGGAIRDPLSGRSYVYQAMRVTGAADPRKPIAETLTGKLPQKKITLGAAKGYSSYGNQIGLATGQVAEVYHENFVAKRMEVGAVIAAAPKRNVVRAVPKKGDVIILVGGRTGRDGCGGATGSSKEHTEESLTSCGAEVQKGNAPTERKIQRLFRNPDVSRMIKRCNDFGAGGVSVAIGELTDGLDINLDAVPKKYDGLDGTELAISESQERMAVVIERRDKERFVAFADAENLEATEVAEVTETNRLKMFWRGKAIVDLSRGFLNTNGVRQEVSVKVAAPDERRNYLKEIAPEVKKFGVDIEKGWLANLQQLNVCSQKGLAERFDSTVGAGTVLMPFGGKNQLTPPEGMAAKLPTMGETNTATAMTFGFNPHMMEWSPFHGAVFAVVESAAKIVAMGGSLANIRLTFQEYFEKLGTDSYKWGKPFSALLGALYAQLMLEIPAIGGKDSMSGTFNDISVPPSLVSFAVDVVKADRVVSPEFKNDSSRVIFVAAEYNEYDLPNMKKIKERFQKVSRLIASGRVSAARSVRRGGIAAAITEMSLGNGIGFRFNRRKEADELFTPKYGSFILELLPNTDLDKYLDETDYEDLGVTIEKAQIIVGGAAISLTQAERAYTQPLEKIFPTKTKDSNMKTVSKTSYGIGNRIRKQSSYAKPRVFIPVFPGTNCEYDSERGFVKAGALVDTLVIRNLTPQAVEESVVKIVEGINNAQIVMLPGGFSAGDEPDGSGKFIAAMFRNPRIKDAVTRLLNRRDGLMLGICNGFQALIKLGLVPYGEIRDLTIDSPTLTYNTIGRHVSCMVETKIMSNLSPWFNNAVIGDIHRIAVSHGEGRFVAGTEVIARLRANGQIATKYVDDMGNPTLKMPYNPNGSMEAIEGITSPDGRVLGKMGHSERVGESVAKNVPGVKDQQLFAAGVAYYK